MSCICTCLCVCSCNYVMHMYLPLCVCVCDCILCVRICTCLCVCGVLMFMCCVVCVLGRGALNVMSAFMCMCLYLPLCVTSWCLCVWVCVGGGKLCVWWLHSCVCSCLFRWVWCLGVCHPHHHHTAKDGLKKRDAVWWGVCSHERMNKNVYPPKNNNNNKETPFSVVLGEDQGVGFIYIGMWSFTTFTYPLTVGVIGALWMTWQPVSSIFFLSILHYF